MIAPVVRCLTRVVLGTAMLAGGALLPACRPTNRSALPSTLPVVEADSPLAAARSLLELLRIHLAAVARHDRQTADDARNRVVVELVARAQVLERAQLIPRGAIKDDQLLARLVENWAAVIQYYADGLDFESARVRFDREGERGGVEIPAAVGADKTLIRVGCVRTAQGKWEVLGLSLDPAPRMTPSAAFPATTPANATAPAATAPATGLPGG